MPQADTTPVVVFDLDGTILRVNSFPHWVRFLIAGRVQNVGLRRRLSLSIRCCMALFRRKMLGTSHDVFMWDLQRAWQSAAMQAGVTLDRFEAALLRQVRPNLRSMLEEVAAGRIDAILATAAAADYAMGLGRQLGFRRTLATLRDRGIGDACNSGEQKRASVRALMDELGWSRRPMILFTDHIDDLPLMRDSSMVCWFGTPEEMSRAAIKAKDTRFVFCRDHQAEAMARCLSQAVHCELEMAAS